MAEPLDNLPDESQLQAPKALRDDLAALSGPATPVPPAVDAAILASARDHLAQSQPRAAVPHLKTLRWAGIAAAAAAAIFLVVIHLGRESEAPARVAARPAAPKAASSTAVVAKAVSVDRSDINGDGRVDILDAFLLAKRVEAREAFDTAWDITGDGLVDRRDVAALAAAAVRLRPAPARDKGAFLSPNGACYDSPGQRPGKQAPPTIQPCRGVLPRDGADRAAAGPSTPFQGCVVLGDPVPRALPWAIVARSFGASEVAAEPRRTHTDLTRLDGGTVQ